MSEIVTRESILDNSYHTEPVTGTRIGDKVYLDIIANLLLSALEDNIETRSMAMKTVIDDASASVTYIGEALPGADLSLSLWRIKKLTETGSVTVIEWADGNGNFDNIWDNRASLTYL